MRVARNNHATTSMIRRDQHTGKLTWTPPEQLPDLSHCKSIAFDVETVDYRLQKKLGPGGINKDGYLLGISIRTDDGYSAYYSLAHPYSDKINWDMDQFRGWFNAQFARPGILKVAANINYDLEWLAAYQMHVAPPYYDIQIAEAIINEEEDGYSLDAIARRRLPEKYWKATGNLEESVVNELIERGVKPDGKAIENIGKCSARAVGVYAEMDAIATHEIYKRQQSDIRDQELGEVLDLEHSLIPIIQLMRWNGVRIDESKLDAARARVSGPYKAAYDRLVKISGIDSKSEAINVNSGDSLSVVLDRLNIPYKLTAKTGKASVTQTFLEQLGHPVGAAILECRKWAKLRNTFLESYESHTQLGRIHCLFHSVRGGDWDQGARSGRFSCSQPNMQQQPKRDDAASQLTRAMFIPEEGCIWGQRDYSQVEYRMIVHYASLLRLPGADKAVAAYNEDASTDFHQWVADLIQRDRSKVAKHINFGLAYGMGKRRLIEQLGLSQKEGDDVFYTYHSEVPFVGKLAKLVEHKASVRGYVRTLSGRRRRFNLFEPANNWNRADRVTPRPRMEMLRQVKEEAQAGGKIYMKDGTSEAPDGRLSRAYCYKAMNALIQGAAADVMKKAMVDAYVAGLFDVLKLHLTVHDELDYSEPQTPEGEEAGAELTRIMENAYTLRVPLVVDAAYGPNWYELF